MTLSHVVRRLCSWVVDDSVAESLALLPAVSGPSGTVPLVEFLAPILAFDRAVVEVVLAVRHPLVTKFLTSVTGLGSAAAAAVFLGVCHLAGWRRELRVGGVALAATGVVVASLMALVQRPFPPQPVCVTDGTGLQAHSFPSGHAAAVTVYAAAAVDSENLPAVPVALVALLVAVSRVYLGTHYASDTLFGVGVGALAYLGARRLLHSRGVVE